ncbi:hypothetical protein [Coleofasciculus chthonoplastes]
MEVGDDVIVRLVDGQIRIFTLAHVRTFITGM